MTGLAAPEAETPAAEPPPRATLLNVQALRALAAFMVVFVHIEALAAMSGARPGIFEFGNAGVDIFFVISGFIMVFTTGRRPMGPLAFLSARLQRIAPLYWSVTLAVFALALIAPRLLQTTRASPAHLLASLLFLPFQREDGATRPVVFVGWTLNLEMAFYVLFAAGLALRRRTLGAGITLAVLVAVVVWGWIWRPTGVAGAFYSTPMVLEFGIGMGLGLAWPWLTSRPRAAVALGAAGLCALAFMVAAPSLFPGAERLWIFGLPAALLVGAALCLEKAGFALNAPWVRTLGNASYAIYLSHFFVAQAVILVARKAGVHDAWAVAGLGVLTFAGVAAAGLGLHFGLEQPAAAALKSASRWRYRAPGRLRRPSVL